MEAAHQIRQAVAEVALLRSARGADPALAQAVGYIKRLQAKRFAGTYSDILQGGTFAAAARFFLDELYSDKDYAQRDAQFARIAGAMEKFFPADVSQTAVALAHLHALTEDLDHSLALAWLALDDSLADAHRYVAAWRQVGRRGDRDEQLRVVLGIGDEMARLTRLPGLRLMLRMMRAPANAAGLSSLQGFLEAGFDTFGAMAKQRGAAELFLATIREREEQLISALFDEDAVACGTELSRTLGQAR